MNLLRISMFFLNGWSRYSLHKARNENTYASTALSVFFPFSIWFRVVDAYMPDSLKTWSKPLFSIYFPMAFKKAKTTWNSPKQNTKCLFTPSFLLIVKLLSATANLLKLLSFYCMSWWQYFDISLKQNISLFSQRGVLEQVAVLWCWLRMYVERLWN